MCCFSATRWQAGETPESQADYIQALQDSDLTLHPVGVNSECYRAYEALSYGSVPVIENIMTPGHCGSKGGGAKNDAVVSAPFRLLKELGAPVIYVTTGRELVGILVQEQRRTHKEIVERRRKVIEWYDKFKRTIKERFLRIIEDEFRSDAVW